MNFDRRKNVDIVKLFVRKLINHFIKMEQEINDSMRFYLHDVVQ